MEWQAGRELDQEIAETIFGWAVEHVPGVGAYCWTVNTTEDWHAYAARSEAEAWDYAPYYSTDMSAAWTIVEHVHTWIFSKRQRFFAALYIMGKTEGGFASWPGMLTLFGKGDYPTFPLALCRAALAALEGDVMPAPDSPTSQGAPEP